MPFLSSQAIFFSTADKVRLEADIYPTRHPWCVLAHGKKYDKNSWQALATEMQGWGWTALAPNFRGYGQSELGDGSRYDQDILASISFARSEHARPIVLLGASMGGEAVLAALAESDLPVDAVILLSPAGGTEYLPRLAGKVSCGLLLFSENEAYADPARVIAGHSPFPILVRRWPGNLHAHHLLDDPDLGPEVRSAIGDFLVHQVGLKNAAR
ncbi:alpha/beta hydrolase [Acidithiobacillus sp. M4-SHS-6]|uniref:alpha/beta hydrolase n=1 Tax=Acidithiobacillus sp. M4-SHS-6 TaxID=3383024 RepID=UPI0039BDB76E